VSLNFQPPLNPGERGYIFNFDLEKT